MNLLTANTRRFIRRPNPGKYRKTVRILAAIMVSLVFFTFTGIGYGAAGELRAGMARVSLTPETDEPVHDPVFARCLVLEAGGQRLIFVSADFGGVTSEEIEKKCRGKYRVLRGF